MANISLKELESEIFEIIFTEKSAIEKAKLIEENLTAFKCQRIAEVNKIETRIYSLGKKSVSANDFELQKLEMEIILLRLFKIAYEKNKFNEIVKSINKIIL